MGFDIKKEYGTDEKKEVEGVWETLGEGCKVLVARTGNPKYEKVYNRITKPYRQQIKRDSLSEEKARDITIQLIAESVLLDWQGIEEDGKPVKYSKKEAIRLLTKYKDFRNAVSELAGSIALFKSQEDEELEKNLPTT